LIFFYEIGNFIVQYYKEGPTQDMKFVANTIRSCSFKHVEFGVFFIITFWGLHEWTCL